MWLAQGRCSYWLRYIKLLCASWVASKHVEDVRVPHVLYRWVHFPTYTRALEAAEVPECRQRFGHLSRALSLGMPSCLALRSSAGRGPPPPPIPGRPRSTMQSLSDRSRHTSSRARLLLPANQLLLASPCQLTSLADLHLLASRRLAPLRHRGWPRFAPMHNLGDAGMRKGPMGRYQRHGEMRQIYSCSFPSWRHAAACRSWRPRALPPGGRARTS